MRFMPLDMSFFVWISQVLEFMQLCDDGVEWIERLI